MKSGSPVSYFTSFVCDGIVGFIWICILTLLIHHYNYCKSIDIPCSLEPTVTAPPMNSAADSRKWKTNQHNSDPTNYWSKAIPIPEIDLRISVIAQ